MPETIAVLNFYIHTRLYIASHKAKPRRLTTQA